MTEWILDLKERFVHNFIEKERWRYMMDGLSVTLRVTILALIIGCVIGVVIALIRTSHDDLKPSWTGSVKEFLLKLFNKIATLYLTVIRGTPTSLQLMIMYFIIFSDAKDPFLSAVLAFGINSGAYIAEIIRGGIVSVDQGQMEAGRSLGLGYIPSLRLIILPQAFKNSFPAMGNEIITLLKETSVSGFITLADLTRGANIIKGLTYDAFFPLIGAAAIYLVIVVILSKIFDIIERRMHQSDQRL